MMVRQQFKQFYKKGCYLIIISMIMILSPCFMSHAEEENPISIAFTYGFDGFARVDSSTPIQITVTNSKEEIKGKIQVLISSLTPASSPIESMFSNGYKEKNYMYEKKVDIAANSTTDIDMVIPLMSQTSHIKILLYDEYDNLMVSSEQEVDSEDYTYYVYAGILTKDLSVLNYFENTTLYQYNDYTFRAIMIKEEDIPLENYGLNSLHILITDQELLNQLSKEQRQVIYNWEKNGGYLVNLSLLSQNASISWESLIPVTQLKKIAYAYQSYPNWSITYALGNVFMNKLPKFSLYVLIFLVYVLLTGPLLYIVLKKIKKRRLFWLCQIASSILFTFIVIISGNTTRLKAPFINYFNIVSYNKDTIDDSVYFNIRAPYNNDYKLYIDKDYSISPIYDYSYYYNDRRKKIQFNNYNVGIIKNEQETMIHVNNDVAFTKEYFYAEKTYEIKGSSLVNANMNLFSDNVSGIVTNNLDEPIENAAICIYNKIIFLNTIPAKSTIDLKDKEIYTYNPKFKFGLTNEMAGLKIDKNGLIKDGYMLQNQKKTILDFYLDKKFSVYDNKAYLIGFTKDDNHLDMQLDSSYDAYGMTLVEVPVSVDYSNQDYSYTSYIPIKNEEYSSSGDIMYTDEMILTYSLGQEMTDISLFFNDLSYYDEEYYKAFSGHIYFYNRNTTLYDPIDLSVKKVSAEMLKPYLDEQNNIVIKYVERFDKEEKQALLPSLSTTGRVKR